MDNEMDIAIDNSPEFRALILEQMAEVENGNYVILDPDNNFKRGK
jgi:hypothetical protein